MRVYAPCTPTRERELPVPNPALAPTSGTCPWGSDQWRSIAHGDLGSATQFPVCTDRPVTGQPPSPRDSSTIRWQSRSKLMPILAAALGSREWLVKPGMVLISRR